MPSLTAAQWERTAALLMRMQAGLRLAEATGDPIAAVIRECIAGVEQGAAAGDIAEVNDAVTLLGLRLKVWNEE